ncbi:hypothetical protein BSF42_22480 [Flavobacterium sp. ACN6]|nr:DUF6734 family protein [Flavobacterium sp. ACN6]PBJ12293.1 hypothetical protein BSF42_22480 [Flavobacterium sp. ACN6]
MRVLISKIIGDNQYRGFGDFERVPYNNDYIHLLGSYKRNDFVCKQMANRLRQDYPEYYYRIIDLFKRNKLSLYKDYYKLGTTTENYLLHRYRKLLDNDLKNKKESSAKSLNFDFKRNLIKELGGFKLNKGQFIDFEIFSSKIDAIVKKDFMLFSKDYLYPRDCKANSYFQSLFENNIEIYSKVLMSDKDYRIIESKYNWSSFIEKQKVKDENEIVILEESETSFSTLIIPECDQDRFSLVYVDSLDMLILDILKRKKTIGELMEELKNYFDTKELKNNFKEFEELIFGRIRLGLYAKSIKYIKL